MIENIYTNLSPFPIYLAPSFHRVCNKIKHTSHQTWSVDDSSQNCIKYLFRFAITLLHCSVRLRMKMQKEKSSNFFYDFLVPQFKRS